MDVTIGDVVASACSYLIGSIPVAWIVVRLSTGKDLRHEGSTNIGARNSYDVSGNVWIGFLVALLDIGKAILAVALARTLTESFHGVAAAGLCVVLGHNWSIFLKGRGGRGLAPSAGVALAINPLPLILWLLMYATGYYAIRRNIHVGSVTGTLGTAILIVNTPGALLHAMAVSEPFVTLEFKIAVVAICVAILVRHIGPIHRLLHQERGDTTVQ